MPIKLPSHLYQHGYYKQTDGKDENGKPNSLDLKDQRPRFEIRLRGGGLPFSDWNDWRCFKFESLRKDSLISAN